MAHAVVLAAREGAPAGRSSASHLLPWAQKRQLRQLRQLPHARGKPTCTAVSFSTTALTATGAAGSASSQAGWAAASGAWVGRGVAGARGWGQEGGVHSGRWVDRGRRGVARTGWEARGGGRRHGSQNPGAVIQMYCTSDSPAIAVVWPLNARACANQSGITCGAPALSPPRLPAAARLPRWTFCTPYNPLRLVQYVDMQYTVIIRAAPSALQGLRPIYDHM